MVIKWVCRWKKETALGAGGRKFESYRPDHLFQALAALAVSAFVVLGALLGSVCALVF